MHTQENLDAFCKHLELEYIHLFEGPEYAYAKARTTPAALARKMTLGLDDGTASNDGEGIRRTCKHFKIGTSYKAIRAFLNAK